VVASADISSSWGMDVLALKRDLGEALQYLLNPAKKY
jgi:hypothetical protein